MESYIRFNHNMLFQVNQYSGSDLGEPHYIGITAVGNTKMRRLTMAKKEETKRQ